ncbi:M3 family metallopeptidase [Sinomicrobium soli]|uniref:M3 family metallopeptidase n=1 Tax=Sinomicrobium sp. N-1-3-6 TaxID=2219864 RepID=UPI000DCE7C8F|nr:M3 family metallopeptidase [Sinomicrobium sp. N-1-3-6]RAV30838.1 M3 family peptidase [Sinomicrobium sp. N-1-3-6]
MCGTAKELFNTPYGAAPFSKIKSSDFLPLIEREIENTRKEIDRITSNPLPPDFSNTVEALEFSGEYLDRLSSMFFNLNSAETNTEIQQLAREISPLLSAFANDIRLNQVLFRRVEEVYVQRDRLGLTPEQYTLLDKQYKSFARNGAALEEEKKKRLREIDAELSSLSLKFGEHVLAETNKFELHITDSNQLSGLPEGTVEAAKNLAESRNKEGWVFTLDYPSFIPFMTYADHRELRKEMLLASGSKAFHGDDLDNRDTVLSIVRLRCERARLLGYKTHAHYVLEERMAGSPEKVEEFLNEMLEKAKPAALREFEKLQEFAREQDGITPLQKWDGAYYTEKLKQKLFELDDEKLKPYFKLENVIRGAFTVAHKLYGLSFEEIKDVDKYHEEVLTYRVTDTNGRFIALFYADFFPRPGKRNGAWMTSYKPQAVKNGREERPHISIVCNFTRPTKTRPSLLTFNEVTTLFHEFGHALHGMLADTVYPSLSGTSVYWDFVELPSQVLENWCYEKEALELFAKHYETGEDLPMEYIRKIKESSSFMEGMQTLRQLSFGLLDMSWHATDPTAVRDVKKHEDLVFSATNLYPETPQTCMSTAFSHIFQGGYSSGYYSYKWAEVLDADAFELFKEKGIFNKEVAESFKTNILSRGGTENPVILYERFRGQQPNPDALLKRAGLI